MKDREKMGWSNPTLHLQVTSGMAFFYPPLFVQMCSMSYVNYLGLHSTFQMKEHNYLVSSHWSRAYLQVPYPWSAQPSRLYILST